MSNADKIAVAALMVTVLTSVGGWILQWKVAQLQQSSAVINHKPTPAQVVVLRLIYAVIWTITVLAAIIALAGIGIGVGGIVTRANALWHVVLPVAVAIVAITELVLVQGIRKRLRRLFG